MSLTHWEKETSGKGQHTQGVWRGLRESSAAWEARPWPAPAAQGAVESSRSLLETLGIEP